jgi:hypothetical protein
MSRPRDLTHIAHGLSIGLAAGHQDDSREIDIILATTVAMVISARVSGGASQQAEVLSFQTLMERLTDNFIKAGR